MFSSSALIGIFGPKASLQGPWFCIAVTGAPTVTCTWRERMSWHVRKHTHKTTCPMQSRYGFDFGLRGSVIVAFSVRVDFYLFDRLLVPLHGLWFLVALTARQLGCLGTRGTRSFWVAGVWGQGAWAWPSPGILRLKISWSPVPWQGGWNPLFPSWSQAPHLGLLLSLSVLVM